MKQFFSFLCAAALACPMLASEPLTPPVDYSWTSESFAACTLISDAYGDWAFGGEDNYLGSCITITPKDGESNQQRGAWLITPAIQLEAGKSYSFTTTARRNATDEVLEVMYGTAATAAAMTQTCIEPTNITKMWGAQTLTGTITAAETGLYYIGFHCTSANGTELRVGPWQVGDGQGGPVGPSYTDVSVYASPYFPFDDEDYKLYLYTYLTPAVESLKTPDAIVMKNSQGNTVQWGVAPFVNSGYIVCGVDGSLPNGTYSLAIPRGAVQVEGGFLNANDLDLPFDFDRTTTGIAEIEADRNVVRWFTIDGSPVETPSHAGVFIRIANGKSSKVILK